MAVQAAFEIHMLKNIVTMMRPKCNLWEKQRTNTQIGLIFKPLEYIPAGTAAHDLDYPQGKTFV